MDCICVISVMFCKKFKKRKKKNFPSQDQACIKIYVSLTVFFEKQLNILRLAIYGLDIFQLSDVYQMNMYAPS